MFSLWEAMTKYIKAESIVAEDTQGRECHRCRSAGRPNNVNSGSDDAGRKPANCYTPFTCFTYLPVKLAVVKTSMLK